MSSIKNYEKKWVIFLFRWQFSIKEPKNLSNYSLLNHNFILKLTMWYKYLNFEGFVFGDWLAV